MEVLINSAKHESQRPVIPDEIEARVVRDLLNEILVPHRWNVGDLIRQRAGFDTYTMERRVCIVSHVFPAPILDPDTPVAEFRNDIVVLVRMGPTLQPQEFPVQSWRFERYDGSVAPAG